MIVSIKNIEHARQISAIIDRYLERFAQKIPTKSAVFYWLFFGKLALKISTKFSRNWPIFLWICPWKSHEIWLIFCYLSEALTIRHNNGILQTGYLHTSKYHKCISNTRISWFGCRDITGSNQFLLIMHFALCHICRKGGFCWWIV